MGSWMRAPWWVPALLTSCLVVSIVGLALAVIASIVVPDTAAARRLGDEARDDATLERC